MVSALVEVYILRVLSSFDVESTSGCRLRYVQGECRSLSVDD